MGHLEWDKLKRKVGHFQWDGGSNFLQIKDRGVVRIKHIPNLSTGKF